MEEEKYYQILSGYCVGDKFNLKTDRGNGVIENEVELVYIDKTPQLKFKKGGQSSVQNQSAG